ncbi:hypothetical protein SEA_FIZZLES_90 [Microbacterium phage Fizzles]|nr:hypothetical protein SEA_FIZZLES_90 [Microbacterium phage Fizzles]
MTLTAPTEVYLGRTARDELIFANVRIEPAKPDQTVTFTDHSTGPRPEEIGIYFLTVQAYRDRARNAGLTTADFPDSRWGSSGQVPAEDRVLIGNVDPAVRVVERAWERHHLNLMHAECEHMTEGMLNPSDDVLTAYMQAVVEERGEWREKYSPAFYGRADALSKWRVSSVTCPVTGYRYGHAWLARKVEPIEVDALRTAVAKLPRSVR